MTAVINNYLLDPTDELIKKEFDEMQEYRKYANTVSMIEKQEELKKTLDDEVCIKIINNRIINTTEIVKNKNIIENEFYIMIYDNLKDNIENELNKRANTWIQRLKNCELKSEVLEERDIILLIKSFTIPEFARTEGTDYADNIVKITF